MVDALGRVRLFHGMNVVYKEWPWYPPSETFDPKCSLADVDMELLEEWGFNVVRLGVMWPGVEPARGKVDAEYLRQMSSLTERLAAHGVYTLVDFHQDLLSRRFCGEGVPEFYMDDLLADPSSRVSQAAPFPSSTGLAGLDSSWARSLHLQELRSAFTVNASGYPPAKECSRFPFLQYYLSDRVSATFAEMFQNGTALNEGVKRYWRTVAAEFAGKPQILGYEMVNEPYALCVGSSSGHCSGSEVYSMLGISFASRPLGDFYRDVAAVIRSTGAQQPIFFEMLLNQLLTAERVIDKAGQVDFSYHAYCAPGDDGSNVLLDGLCSVIQALEGASVAQLWNDNPSLNGFLSEFGAVGPSKAELDHLNIWLQMADGHFQGWAYWQLKDYHDLTTQNRDEPLYGPTGALETEKLRTLSRTYAQAIAGSPVQMYFNSSDSSFVLSYVASTVAALEGAATEIYLNEVLHYPGGYNVTVLPASCLIQQASRNRLHLRLDLDRIHSESLECNTITVKIRANKEV